MGLDKTECSVRCHVGEVMEDILCTDEVVFFTTPVQNI